MKDELFTLFYDVSLPQLIECLSTTKDDLTKSLCLELLACCASTHGYRIRYYVIHNSVLQRLLNLYKDQKKCIILSMVRFFRALISSQDDSLNRYVAKHDLMQPIVTLLQNNKRENMMTSALLELFAYIFSQNLKILISYIMEKHKDIIIDSKYSSCKVMKGIKIKYEQLMQDRPVKRTEITYG